MKSILEFFCVAPDKTNLIIREEMLKVGIMPKNIFSQITGTGFIMYFAENFTFLQMKSILKLKFFASDIMI